MANVNDLPYYPRFIFNFDDGNCFSTGDLDELEFIKEHGTNYKITHFFAGQKIDITKINEKNEQDLKTYNVNKIEIRRIKYDLNEKEYGINLNDCSEIFGKQKKWLMEIYVFMEKMNTFTQ